MVRRKKGGRQMVMSEVIAGRLGERESKKGDLILVRQVHVTLRATSVQAYAEGAGTET